MTIAEAVRAVGDQDIETVGEAVAAILGIAGITVICSAAVIGSVTAFIDGSGSRRYYWLGVAIGCVVAWAIGTWLFASAAPGFDG